MIKPGNKTVSGSVRASFTWKNINLKDIDEELVGQTDNQVRFDFLQHMLELLDAKKPDIVPIQHDLLKILIKFVQNEAVEDEKTFALCNLDEEDPLRECFDPPKFRTLFMHKLVAEKENEKLGMMNPKNFFDPRDL